MKALGMFEGNIALRIYLTHAENFQVFVFPADSMRAFMEPVEDFDVCVKSLNLEKAND
jgi:hypothetical protein